MQAEARTKRGADARPDRKNRFGILAVIVLLVGYNVDPSHADSAAVDATEAEEALRRWNAEFERDLIPVSDGVHAAIGYGASVFAFIEGTDGIVMIDAGHHPIWSAEALADYRAISDKPIRAVIYTHAHIDHTGGARAFVPEGDSTIEVWAHPDYARESRTFNESGITANRMRGARQAGMLLPQEKRINNGVGPSVRPPDDSWRRPETRVPPNRFLEADTQSVTIAGIELELVANPGETKDQIYVWYPDKGVVFAGDNFYKSWPNLYAIRGTPYRDVDEWARAIEALLNVGADRLVGGHTRPIMGADAVREALTDYRDGMRSVLNQTIDGINKGLTPNQIVETVSLPESLGNNPILTPWYGHPEWAVRSIFNGYLGWFDGNATNLFPLSDREEALRIAALAGGPGQLLQNAERALSDGDDQWAAQLADYLIALEYESSSARDIKAAALTRLGRNQHTATARNYYLTAAQQLRRENARAGNESPEGEERKQ